MGKRHDALEPKHASATLDRMHRSESVVDPFLAASSALNGGQRFLQIANMFFAFIAEHRFESFEIGLHPPGLRFLARCHYGAKRSINLTRETGSNGLVIQAVAPAALAALFNSLSLSVVMKMKGLAMNSGLSRMLCRNSKPPITTILR